MVTSRAVKRRLIPFSCSLRVLKSLGGVYGITQKYDILVSEWHVIILKKPQISGDCIVSRLR